MTTLKEQALKAFQNYFKAYTVDSAYIRAKLIEANSFNNWCAKDLAARGNSNAFWEAVIKWCPVAGTNEVTEAVKPQDAQESVDNAVIARDKAIASVLAIEPTQTSFQEIAAIFYANNWSMTPQQEIEFHEKHWIVLPAKAYNASIHQLMLVVYLRTTFRIIEECGKEARKEGDMKFNTSYIDVTDFICDVGTKIIDCYHCIPAHWELCGTFRKTFLSIFAEIPIALIDFDAYEEDERYCIQNEESLGEVSGALDWEWELNFGAMLAEYPPIIPTDKNDGWDILQCLMGKNLTDREQAILDKHYELVTRLNPQQWYWDSENNRLLDGEDIERQLCALAHE